MFSLFPGRVGRNEKREDAPGFQAARLTAPTVEFQCCGAKRAPNTEEGVEDSDRSAAVVLTF